MKDPMIPSSLRICKKKIVTFLQRINPGASEGKRRETSRAGLADREDNDYIEAIA